MLMGGFLGMLLYRCINNETVKVESYLEKVNKVKDVNRTLTLNRNNSEFSIYFGYQGTDAEVHENLDLYFDIWLQTIDYESINSAEEIKAQV